MNYQQFEMAFWHPFGSHSGETPEEIIERKQGEIQRCGWTLWSFQNRRTMLPLWHTQLENWCSEKTRDDTGRVFAFCSDSRGAKDPMNTGNKEKVKKDNCTHYLQVDEAEDDNWRPVPPGIRALHSFKKSVSHPQCSAFMVKKIIYPAEEPHRLKSAAVWFAKSGEWRQERTNGDKCLPTRGEYLIRPHPQGVPLRRIRAVLELAPPYLAQLKY